MQQRITVKAETRGLKAEEIRNPKFESPGGRPPNKFEFMEREWLKRIYTLAWGGWK